MVANETVADYFNAMVVPTAGSVLFAEPTMMLTGMFEPEEIPAGIWKLT
jgi:hypothetical protein